MIYFIIFGTIFISILTILSGLKSRMTGCLLQGYRPLRPLRQPKQS